jgi:molybdopterin-biosynthesis enzyme MoeA-like protein
MATAEIVVVSQREGAAEQTAATLYGQIKALGIDITKVTTVADQPDAVADEVRAVLQRRPSIVVLVGGLLESAVQGISTGTDRRWINGLPAGACSFDTFQGFGMLVAQSYVLAVPADLPDHVWDEEVTPCLAEWVGSPSHIRGELVILDASAGAVEQLLSSLTEQHPDVYLRTEPAQGTSGIRVAALCYGEAPAGETAVDIALSSIERAAVASRLRVSSTGHKPARLIEPFAAAKA